MLKRIALTAVVTAATLANTGVFAADLARKAPAYVPPPAPTYVWTGCYLGLNIGGAWSNASVTDNTTGATGSLSNSGVAGGGQIGCDYQFAGGQFLIGFRNMFDGTSLSKSVSFSDGVFAGNASTNLRWFDTLTARGGFLVQPNVLLYVQGGAAWTQGDVSLPFGTLSGNRRTGWTVGGGAEWMFQPRWSVFLEYNYMNWGDRSGTICVGAVCDAFSGKANLQNVLVGVNYRFF